MKRPLTENHRAVSKVTSYSQLWRILHRQKSIYYKPLGRVMPTKFFMGYAWKIDTLYRHIDKESFVEVIIETNRP